MLNLLSEFRSGFVDGVKVRMGRLQNLIASSCLEHLDFVQHIDFEELDITPFEQLENEHVGYQTLTDIPVQRAVVEEKKDFLVIYKVLFCVYNSISAKGYHCPFPPPSPSPPPSPFCNLLENLMTSEVN